LFPVRDRWGIGKAWVCWVCVDADAPHVVVLGALSSSANALPAFTPTLGNGCRCRGNIACGFASLVFRQRHHSRRWTAAQPLPDSRMSTFLEFLSAAGDFAVTLNLKAAIVAAGFILMLVLTRRRGAE